MFGNDTCLPALPYHRSYPSGRVTQDIGTSSEKPVITTKI